MPGLGETVAGALGGDRTAVELAGEADREVADVDHFLDLAERLGADLARFDGDEVGQLVLVVTQQLAQAAHEFAAAGRRRGAPGEERLAGGGDGLLGVLGGGRAQTEEVFPGDGAAGGEVAPFPDGDADGGQADAGTGAQVLGGGEDGAGHGAPLGC